LIRLTENRFSNQLSGQTLVNNRCISIRGQGVELCYAVYSSLKERNGWWKSKDELLVSGIIPGDWGKVRSGWLIWLLGNQDASFGEAVFTSSSGGVRTPSYANEGIGSKQR
jgi:hypothetical protein